MSCSRSSAAAFRFSRLPEAKLSIATTSSPRSRSASSRFEPMMPAPPVTRAFTGPYRRRSMFVTFEGIDWSGKSTQTRLLADWLRGQGRTVLETREPGGTPAAEAIREVVLHGPEMAPWTEAALYAAARADHVALAIRPALERGEDVICDRYIESSVAYQGIARGLGEDRVRDLSLMVTDGLLPDRCVVVLLDPEGAAARARKGRDRIERAADDF